MNLEQLEAKMLDDLAPIKGIDGFYAIDEAMLLQVMKMAHTAGQAVGYQKAHDFALGQLDKVFGKGDAA